MIKPSRPDNEVARLTALRSYGALDTPAEKDFDDLVDMAAQICETPIALISLVDEDRQWFKAVYGLTASETPRDVSFCGHAILQPDIFVVPDASKDERFADNPLVTEDLGIRFYAGAQLIAPEGQRLGALCVMDRRPRQLTPEQEHALSVLSRHVMAQLELRRKKRDMTRINNALLGILEDERLADTAKRQSERRFRELLENIGLISMTMDQNGLITFCNEYLLELTGWKREEVLGADWCAKFLLETDVGTRSLFFDNIGSGTIPSHYESPIKTREGQVRQIRWHNTMLRDEGENIVGTASIGEDITERKLAEEQLLWKTALFEAQAHSTLDGILVVDHQGNKILENQRMIDMWQFPPEIVDDANDAKRLEWAARKSKNPRQFVENVAYLYAHPDEIGRDELELLDGRVIDRYSAPVRGRDGKSYGRIWLFRDITKPKRAERKIAEQADLLDKARDAIVVRDLKGIILFWNQGAERVYGWTREEVTGQNIAGLLYPNLKKYEEVSGLALSQGEWHGELLLHTKNRGEITVEARWTLIRDDDGNPKSILAISTDITEKKKIEAQFMRAQRMESIGTLAGGIAHDLNNILAPIMMSIDILKEMSTDPQAGEVLETIEMSAQRGSDIVRQVLSFARGLEGERVEIQPRHLLRDLEKIIKDTFPKDIRLHFIAPHDTWTILGDPTQLHQILLNLCVNARDAMPTGGTMTIQIENCELDEQYVAMNLQARAGRFVKIAVTDSGTGVPPELLDKIFEPFFTTKELSKGTGLGLSTVMAIVKGHDGIINVYSEPGNGTTFHVYLPALEVSMNRLEESQAASLPRGHGEVILVVDDEASILTITSQTLQAFGYRILKATDGAEAVSVFAQHRQEIAVVLTDMMMPIMDGAATIQAIMRIEPKVKILAVSGLNANNTLAKASGIGVKHFLTKPYTAGTLLKAMRTVLEEVG